MSASSYSISTTLTVDGGTVTTNRFFDAGVLVRVTATFLNSSAAVADPTDIFFAYKWNGGTRTILHYGVDAALAKTSTGIYYVELDTTTGGLLDWNFYSTGTGQAAAHDYFYARPAPTSNAT